MTRAALLVLSSAILLSSCSNDDVNGPFQFTGTCDVIEVTDVTLDTDPATVARFEALANCNMGPEIGEVGAVVDYVVTSNTANNSLVITAQSFYSASQTDILTAEFEGTGTQVSATTINFAGVETGVEGRHQRLRRHLLGSAEISGGTLTITAPGSGGWTVVGAIE